MSFARSASIVQRSLALIRSVNQAASAQTQAAAVTVEPARTRGLGNSDDLLRPCCFAQCKSRQVPSVGWAAKAQHALEVVSSFVKLPFQAPTWV